MGHSQLEKQRTHSRIVDIASKRFRETGLNGIGVADLMKEAGLTVGGFYKHFSSRDDLVAEALDAAFKGYEQRLIAKGTRAEDLSYDDAISSYLRTGHRDNPGEGCAFSSLSGDIARSDGNTRHIATERFKHDTNVMAGRLGSENEKDSRRKALLAICAMAGAVGFSRMVDDEELSNEILTVVKEELLRMADTGVAT